MYPPVILYIRIWNTTKLVVTELLISIKSVEYINLNSRLQTKYIISVLSAVGGIAGCSLLFCSLAFRLLLFCFVVAKRLQKDIWYWWWYSWSYHRCSGRHLPHVMGPFYVINLKRICATKIILIFPDRLKIICEVFHFSYHSYLVSTSRVLWSIGLRIMDSTFY